MERGQRRTAGLGTKAARDRPGDRVGAMSFLVWRANQTDAGRLLLLRSSRLAPRLLLVRLDRLRRRRHIERGGGTWLAGADRAGCSRDMVVQQTGPAGNRSRQLR